MGQRFADTYNSAAVPGYVVFNAMLSYRVNAHLDLQLNLNNIADKLYYSSLYYTEVARTTRSPGRAGPAPDGEGALLAEEDPQRESGPCRPGLPVTAVSRGLHPRGARGGKPPAAAGAR